ncbi:hypothetical protein D3C81_1457350 [compost metagenome]
MALREGFPLPIGRAAWRVVRRDPQVAHHAETTRPLGGGGDVLAAVRLQVAAQLLSCGLQTGVWHARHHFVGIVIKRQMQGLLRRSCGVGEGIGQALMVERGGTAALGRIESLEAEAAGHGLAVMEAAVVMPARRPGNVRGKPDPLLPQTQRTLHVGRQRCGAGSGGEDEGGNRDKRSQR